MEAVGGVHFGRISLLPNIFEDQVFVGLPVDLVLKLGLENRLRRIGAHLFGQAVEVNIISVFLDEVFGDKDTLCPLGN